ncbi:MAG TPA: hypothetical protein VFO41_11660, partial [Alphaproteobacteria bacterium]|nr:hypothetical protein [Alphaproteobacteria bacterium]
MPRMNFLFQADDPVVLAYLRQPEINRVGRWQTSNAYTFEWHDGHPTGHPLYIRPDGNGDNSNIPKVDTRNKTAAHYPDINAIPNSDKLGGLRERDRAEILAIIHEEWDIFAELARRIWENDGINEGPSLLEQWAEAETEDTPVIAVRSLAEFRWVAFG